MNITNNSNAKVIFVSNHHRTLVSNLLIVSNHHIHLQLASTLAKIIS
jgi:hypothetical protein